MRYFGLIFGLMLVAVFVLLLPWLRGGGYPAWPWIPACLLWVVASFFPAALRPIYGLWMRFAMVINAVVTRVVLGIIYYMVVFPMGMVMRLLGKDPMARRWMTTLQSYRIPSQSSTTNDMENPF